MLRALGVFLAILACPRLVAADQANPGGNAALKYWQAFAQLPKLSQEEVDKLNADCLTMPLDAHARDLVARVDYAMMMLHHAAAQRGCDWGVGYEAGFGTRLPQAQASRNLTSFACLRTRLRLAEGRNAEAVDDLLDCMTLARHVSIDGVSIMVLVGYSNEARARQVLLSGLPKFDKQLQAQLQKRLADLPAGGSPVLALPFEKKSFEISVIDEAKAAKDKDALTAAMGQLFVGEPSDHGAPDKGRQFIQDCGGTKEGVLKIAADMQATYPRMAQILSLPLDNCVTEWEALEKQEANNPLFKIIPTRLPNIRMAQLRTEIQRAMLATAVAIQLEGRDALQSHLDPVTGKPFEYVSKDGGFELHSTFKANDHTGTFLKSDPSKQLTITVGEIGK